MEVDEGEESDADPATGEETTTATTATMNEDEKDDAEIDALAKAESKEREAARKERMELMAAQQKKLAMDQPQGGNASVRLQYLMAQSDVFAHFLAGK